MKTKSMLCMLSAVAAITIAITGNASAQQGSSQQKYADDAIVRDLKAGKLTVREAQILQDRREHATAKTLSTTAASADAPKTAVKKVHAAKPVKPGKAAKPGKAVKKNSKAPVKHLTSPHPKHGQQDQPTPKGKKTATKPHHAVTTKEEQGKTVKPARKKAKAATKKTEPVRKTAVKYIR